LFDLFARDSLPLDPLPAATPVTFPVHFEVKAVTKAVPWADGLLVLAVDERSAPSREERPDIRAELLTKSGRIWNISDDTLNATLFEPDLLPANVRSPLLVEENLWLAGETTCCFDPRTRRVLKFGGQDGLDAAQTYSLAACGARVFAA